jgi:hypothetical protein
VCPYVLSPTCAGCSSNSSSGAAGEVRDRGGGAEPAAAEEEEEEEEEAEEAEAEAAAAAVGAGAGRLRGDSRSFELEVGGSGEYGLLPPLLLLLPLPFDSAHNTSQRNTEPGIT